MATNVYICIDIYTVRPGDTLYSIARQYQIPVKLLMRANRIRNPYNLRIGSRLCIPSAKPQPGMPSPPENRPVPDPPPTPEENNRPSCRAVHIVKPKDTLYLIAKMHRVKLDALMHANPDIDPYNLQIGMELCIPR